MARPQQPRSIESVTVASTASTIVAANPNPTIHSNSLPSGDLALTELYYYYDGTINQSGAADGTVIADGQFKFLRGLTVRTDKHQRIVDDVDGLGLFRIAEFTDGEPGLSEEIDSNADNETFRASLTVPFAQRNYFRPYDAILDMKYARMTVEAKWGNYTDLLSGAAATNNIDDLIADLSVRQLPGPLVEAPDAFSELPNWMTHLSMDRVDIASTQTNRKIALPYGDRIIRRVYISQRNSVTFAELNNTVIQAEDRISLEVNGVRWVDNLKNHEIQAENRRAFRTAAGRDGWTVLQFDQTGRFPDFLSLLDAGNGSANLLLDVRSVTNGALWIYVESFKPVPEAARRPRVAAAA